MYQATKPVTRNILIQPFVLMILLGVAPVFNWAEELGEQRAVQERDPLLKSFVEGPRPQYSPESPSKCECPGPLNHVTSKTPDVGESRLRTNPDCLAAHYDFSDFDPATGCVKDKSGNGFNLSTVGKPATAVQGISGKAAQLNGGYFQAKGNPLADADHFTISVWFKTAEPMNNYKLVSAAVWSGGNNASGWNVGTHYCEFWADYEEGSLRGEPGWERSAEFRKGEWNHLVVSYDGAHVREYINGKPSAKILGTGRRVGDGVPMVVGAWMGSFQFHGELDELRIYRRSLKKKEIQSLYKAPTNEQ
jgi:Concanavalin A-like lectin/glucanases superfamily